MSAPNLTPVHPVVVGIFHSSSNLVVALEEKKDGHQSHQDASFGVHELLWKAEAQCVHTHSSSIYPLHSDDCVATNTGAMLQHHNLLWREQDAMLRFRVSPSGHRVLSQSPVTRSPRPAFTLTAELFIKGEESTGDPANFSMGLLAVLTVGCPMKRHARWGRFEMICEYFTQYIFNFKWTSLAIYTIKSALSDSLTCGGAERSCVS